MTDDMKSGDQRMVVISSYTPGQGWAFVSDQSGRRDNVLYLSCLHPMPPTKTPEEQAVINAAELLISNSQIDMVPPLLQLFVDAVTALRRSRSEHHPVQALLDALRADPDASERHRKAIEKAQAAALGRR
ncbi:MAG: hypothetical protein KGL35_11845 [Bradyrhizobium sp.]|nr:hypothetical protein [Bradyrhizobium sp.]